MDGWILSFLPFTNLLIYLVNTYFRLLSWGLVTGDWPTPKRKLPISLSAVQNPRDCNANRETEWQKSFSLAHVFGYPLGWISVFAGDITAPTQCPMVSHKCSLSTNQSLLLWQQFSNAHRYAIWRGVLGIPKDYSLNYKWETIEASPGTYFCFFYDVSWSWIPG